MASSRLQVHVVKSGSAFQGLVQERFLENSYHLDTNVGAVLMSQPNDMPEDLRVGPLIAMRQAWGNPATSQMAPALARYTVGNFHGERLAAAAMIAYEEPPYTFEEVFGTNGKYLSPLVRDALSAIWVVHAESMNGKDLLPDLYSQDLTKSQLLCRDCIPKCTSLPDPDPKNRQSLGYLKGISFSSEGGTGRGYGSAAAAQEIENIQSIGANAIALIPYLFTAASEQTDIRFRTLESANRLLRSLKVAQDLGLKVVLKPHLWAGARFHGSIAFEQNSRFDI